MGKLLNVNPIFKSKVAATCFFYSFLDSIMLNENSILKNQFTIERFFILLFFHCVSAPLRNDEVDDDHPNKEPLIHEVVLGVNGKVKKHNFEHKSDIPRGNY